MSDSIPEGDVQLSTHTLRPHYWEAMFLIIDFMLVTYHPVCSQARTKAASFHFHLDVAYTEFFPEDLLPSV